MSAGAVVEGAKLAHEVVASSIHRDSAGRKSVFVKISVSTKEMALAAACLYEKKSDCYPFLQAFATATAQNSEEWTACYANAVWESYYRGNGGKGWRQLNKLNPEPKGDCLALFEFMRNMFDRWIILRDHLVKSHFNETYRELHKEKKNIRKFPSLVKEKLFDSKSVNDQKVRIL